MEFTHLLHGEVTADVRVEDKECPGTTPEDLISEVVETAGCAQGGIFLQIPAGGGRPHDNGELIPVRILSLRS